MIEVVMENENDCNDLSHLIVNNMENEGAIEKHDLWV